MNSKEILNNIKKLSTEEKRNISYEQLTEIVNQMTPDEIIKLSNIIGYQYSLECVWESYVINLSYSKMEPQPLS